MRQRVVVGVDGSSTAAAALAWSLEVAACYGADLEALHVWRWDVPTPLPTVPDVPSRFALAARTTAEQQVAHKAADDVGSDVQFLRAFGNGLKNGVLLEYFGKIHS